MTPSEELRAIRKELGRTQTGMARPLLTTLRSYQRWEAGVHKVPDLALQKARELRAGAGRAVRRKK